MRTEGDEVLGLAAVPCGTEGASHKTDAPRNLPSASEPMAAGLRQCVQSIAGRIGSQELMPHRLNEVQFQITHPSPTETSEMPCHKGFGEITGIWTLRS